MARFWFGMGCLMVGLAVAAGAFGAHVLKQRLSADLLVVFETGARYQMIHGLGLVALALAMDRWGGVSLAVGRWALVGRHPSFFRQSLRAEPHRSSRPGGRHPFGRPVFPAGLGIAGLGGLEKGGLIPQQGPGCGVVTGQEQSS